MEDAVVGPFYETGGLAFQVMELSSHGDAQNARDGLLCIAVKALAQAVITGLELRQIDQVGRPFLLPKLLHLWFGFAQVERKRRLGPGVYDLDEHVVGADLVCISKVQTLT